MAVTSLVQKTVLCGVAILLVATAIPSANSSAYGGDSLRVIKLPPSKRKAAPVITALAIQPGGRLLAAAGDDHVVRVWDTDSGKVVHTLDGHTDWVRSAAFTSDGTTLLTAGDDGRVIAWHAEEEMRRTFLVHLAHPVHAIDISPDDLHVAIVGFKTPIHIVDIATGLSSREIKPRHHDLCDVAISHGGKMLAVASGDGVIHIHRFEDGKHLRELRGHKRRVNVVTFMPHSQELLSAGEDRTIRAWDINSAAVARVMRPGRCKITSLAVTKSDNIIVGTSQNSIHIFDGCLLYTSPSPRDKRQSRMPSSA